MRRFIPLYLFIIVLGLFNLAYAVDSSTVIACNQPYALCSSAPCIPDPHNPKYAICNCFTLNGNSLGHTTCEARKPHTDQNNAQHITSTFSLNNTHKKGMKCQSGKVWTNCLDQPCTVNPLNPKQAICSCPIMNNGAFVTFGGDCDISTCATGFWSAALASQVDTLLIGIKNTTPEKDLMCTLPGK